MSANTARITLAILAGFAIVAALCALATSHHIFAAAFMVIGAYACAMRIVPRTASLIDLIIARLYRNKRTTRRAKRAPLRPIR